MKLSDYMTVNKLTDREVANAVSRDRSNVTRWRLGVTRPDFEALIALEQFTKGKVTAKDFMDGNGVAA